MTLQQKKDYAKRLYLSEDGITQKEVALRSDVSAKTINKWVNTEKWDSLRVSMLNSKEGQISSIITQLNNLKDNIESREQKWPTAAEADTIVKLTNSLKSLEVESSVSEKMDVGKDFLRFVRNTANFDMSVQIANLFDAYIKSCM